MVLLLLSKAIKIISNTLNLKKNNKLKSLKLFNYLWNLN